MVLNKIKWHCLRIHFKWRNKCSILLCCWFFRPKLTDDFQSQKGGGDTLLSISNFLNYVYNYVFFCFFLAVTKKTKQWVALVVAALYVYISFFFFVFFLLCLHRLLFSVFCMFTKPDAMPDAFVYVSTHYIFIFIFIPYSHLALCSLFAYHSTIPTAS
jgi:hypothetical protein